MFLLFRARDERISFQTHAVEEDKARRCAAYSPQRAERFRRFRGRFRREETEEKESRQRERFSRGEHQLKRQTKEEGTKNGTKNPRETSPRDGTIDEQRSSDIGIGEWEHAFTPE